ncbi:MAG TPA: homoserine dehydrogenase [Vicinamibacterales bacterium]|nr:homoserine dehydrogenase [Vicinamibacterales bacterium]
MTTCVAASVDIALLGCGNVGTAFARLAGEDLSAGGPLKIIGALVRDAARPREEPALPLLTTDPRALLAQRPDVLVELLGGLEPARSLVLEALERGIPVVTANKTLLAHHGAELRNAARLTGTPLLYEAAVLAGVPFLGTFARRPHAAAASSLAGIVNGTTNFVLTRCAADGCDFAHALDDARRRGYAEPDPRNDVAGIDATEKLAVLLQHFAARSVSPGAIETAGIDSVTGTQTMHARELGGVIKPVIYADWTNEPAAFSGPAFVPSAHVLARVDGVENALLLGTRHGRLLFQGPGAGPEVTAATVLDDVREIAASVGHAARGPLAAEPLAAEPLAAEPATASLAAPDTEWMVTLDGAALPRGVDVADLLASHGVFAHRVSGRAIHRGREHQSLLVWPVSRPQLECALLALCRASGCSTRALRALEPVQ